MENFYSFNHFIVKSLQKEQNNTNPLLDPQSAGINMQSPQSDSTFWTLTLVSGLLTNLYHIYLIDIIPPLNQITVELRVLSCVTDLDMFFAKGSQYISIENPLHKQSEKACMIKTRHYRTRDFTAFLIRLQKFVQSSSWF